VVQFQKGDHVVFVGDLLAERLQLTGYLETMLHSKFPDRELVVRNLGWSGDTPTQQPRPLNFGDMPSHLKAQQADVIVMMFGMAASFEGPVGLPAFEKGLDALVKQYKGQVFGRGPPRLVLVTPIAHETMGGEFADPAGHNAILKDYAAAVVRVAAANGVPAVDLFTPTKALMAVSPTKFTINGVHLAPYGEWAVANLFFRGLGFEPVWFSRNSESLRHVVDEKNRQFFLRWRAVNGEYIYGRRKEPFGVVNFPGEMKQRDEIVAALDASIHDQTRPEGEDPGIPFLNNGKRPPTTPEPVPPVKTDAEVYGQTQGVIGGKEFPTAKEPDEAIKLFKLAPGYAINIFASEKDFPIHNPVAMRWDSRGRLWVACNPTYPQDIPGVPPNDKILILEDTKGTGKADKCTVFADHLYLPIGFEFGDGGVYVSAQPNLLFLKDTDGDDKADVREVVAHDFDSGDSHHAIHAFHYGPDGGLYMGEGTFLRTTAESPTGVLRLFDAGWIRFDTKSRDLSAHVSYGFANPWGQIYDRWGQDFIADASGGDHYFALPFTGHVDHPNKHPGMKRFVPPPPVGVRPTCGCVLVTSRHFPDDTQGDYLFNNCIGFQGVKRHQVIEEGSGFTSKEKEPLLYTSDRNFRPVDINFGPDGALYICDWYNPLVGHMQFPIRDPERDHCHGRIYRVTYPSRPLLTPPKIAGEPTEKVLDCLKAYEDQTRYWARRELAGRPKADVAAAVKIWVAGLDKTAPDYEHNLLEALWVCQTIHHVDAELLARVLSAKDPRARAAGVRAIRYWKDQLPNALALLRTAANDDFPRTRLEAVVACSFFPTPESVGIALEALNHPTDYYLDYGLKETIATLEPQWKAALFAGKPLCESNPAGAAYLMQSVTTADLARLPRTAATFQAMLSRDGLLPDQRREALAGLAALHKTTELNELFSVIHQSEGSHHTAGNHSEHVLADLGALLVSRPVSELRAAKGHLEMLAKESKSPLLRRAAYAAFVTASGSFSDAWRDAAASPETVRTLIEAIPFIADPAVRAQAFAIARPLALAVPPELAKPTPGSVPVTGRVIRITIPSGGKTLTLAEVQVFSNGRNVALKGKATQSSTAYNAPAERAIDGNTDGSFAAGSSTHTRENEFHPWWQVDLGVDYPIDRVVVWNRTDGDLGKRLTGYVLTIADSKNKVVFSKADNPAPALSATFTFPTDPVAAIRRAAVAAMPSFAGKESEAFALLSELVRTDDFRGEAIKALRSIPKSRYPKSLVKPLLDAIVGYVASLPPADRTEPAGIDAFRLGQDLLAALPAEVAKPYRTKLGGLGVRVVELKTLPHRMAYDRSVLYAEAGKPLVIILENTDVMPHNWLLAKPGKTAEVGLAAEQMAAVDPNAQARAYVPNNPNVLVASRLLAPQETQKLTFTAPKQPGDYDYLCTFPGHWRIMNGKLKVVAKLSDVPPELLDAAPTAEASAGPARPFVRNWTMEDLTPDLGKLDKGRSFARGKQLFTAATCSQCHKVGTEGGDVGPPMSELAAKLAAKKVDGKYVLESVIHPSKVIDEKYRQWTVTKLSGGFVSGVKVFEDAEVMRLVAGPNQKPVEVRLADVDEKKPSAVSIMPEGLLVTLTREEILDLLAYAIAGGGEKHPAFKK
jgi:putative heme-binding domain-containing protein